MVEDYVHVRDTSIQRCRRILTTLFLIGGPSITLWTQFSGILPAYPLLALELALPVMMAGRAPRLAAICYLVTAALSFLISVSAVFHFPSPVGLFLQHKGGSGFPVLRTAMDYCGFVVLGIGVLAMAYPIAKLGRSVHWLTGSLVIGLMITVEALGVAPLPATTFGEVNLVGTTLAGNVARIAGLKADTPRHYTDQVPLADFVVGWAQKHPGRSVLFVVSESMGLQIHPSTGTDQTILPPEHTEFRVTSGSVPYSGATTAGELRQLCQLRVPFYDLRPSDVRRCLPARLRELGMNTVGLHGYSSHVFARESWWAAIGLTERVFLESLASEEHGRCGKTLSGLCDEDALRRAVERVKTPGTFVYFLTLTTHLPIDASVVEQPIKAKCARASLPARACWIIGMQNKLLDQIVVQAGGLRPAPLVIVVGDHSPPFIDSVERRVFSQELVPFWIFEPRV